VLQRLRCLKSNGLILFSLVCIFKKNCARRHSFLTTQPSDHKPLLNNNLRTYENIVVDGMRVNKEMVGRKYSGLKSFDNFVCFCLKNDLIFCRITGGDIPEKFGLY